MIKLKDKKCTKLYVRLSEKDKCAIEKYANKCGLTVSEYVRKRALGYAPKENFSKEFNNFSLALYSLGNLCEDRVSEETESKILSLIDEITEKFILPTKERSVM